MPVTKTAKRALRGSKKKELINKKLRAKLEVALRHAKKAGTDKTIRHAISLTDRAAKRNILHKNKASRLKSQLIKLSKATSPKKRIK